MVTKGRPKAATWVKVLENFVEIGSYSNTRTSASDSRRLVFLTQMYHWMKTNITLTYINNFLFEDVLDHLPSLRFAWWNLLRNTEPHAFPTRPTWRRSFWRPSPAAKHHRWSSRRRKPCRSKSMECPLVACKWIADTFVHESYRTGKQRNLLTSTKATDATGRP